MTQHMHVVSGLVGYDSWLRWSDYNDYEIPTGSDIDADADGIMGPAHFAVADLSRAMSALTGRQCPQTATYRILGMKVSLIQVDDGFDNDEAANYFGGDFIMFPPSSHRIDAVQAWRQLHRNVNKTEYDANSLFPASSNEYTGFRFGMFDQAEVADHTALYYETGNDAGLPGGAIQTVVDVNSNLNTMFRRYEPGVNPPAPKNRQMWSTRLGRYSSYPYTVSTTNHQSHPQSRTDCEIRAPEGYHFDPMGGLVGLTVSESAIAASGTNDDFRVKISFLVGGWTEW